MSERFRRIFFSSEKQYVDDAALSLVARGLFSDSQNGRMFALLEFKNNGEKTIKEITIIVSCIGKDGSVVNKPVRYEYKNLSAHEGSVFGQKSPITIESGNAETIIVLLENVIWEDDTSQEFNNAEFHTCYVSKLKKYSSSERKRANKYRRISVLTSVIAVLSIIALAITSINIPIGKHIEKSSNTTTKEKVAKIDSDKTEDSSNSPGENGNEDASVEENESSSSSSQEEKPLKGKVLDKEPKDIITFRGIPWYSKKVDVESTLAHNESDDFDGYSSEDEMLRMGGTDYPNVISGADRIEDGGYQTYFYGLDVAGYTPDAVYACYMYDVKNGKLDKKEDDTRFYMAYYQFTDYEDIKGLYSDLENKLKGLYGQKKQKNDGYLTSITWSDKDNNKVRLLKDNDNSYVVITYMANGADKKLDDLQKALKKDKAKEEKENRDTNNSSGL